MHTISWRSLLGPLLVAVAASVVLTESAQAQQTGLFPLHPIKRQRVPCSQEDPVYRIYKDQYFGYHPTLWRRFPSGWGAPSPEAPDAKASFKEIPLQYPEDYSDGGEPGADPGAEAPARPGGALPNLPTPPAEDERSPFEMDAPRPGNTPPAAEAPARTEPATPADDPNRSPFDLDPRASAPRPKPPELAPPAIPSASRGGRGRRMTDEDAALAGSPLLAMPDAGVDEAYEAPSLGGPAPSPAPGHDHAHNHGNAGQTPRRNRLAAMMDNLGWGVSRR
jgi:hypothetical protein